MSVHGSVGASSIRPGPGPHSLAPPVTSRKRKDRDYVERSNPNPRPLPNFSIPPSAASFSSLLGLPHPPHLTRSQLQNPLPAPAAAKQPAAGTAGPSAVTHPAKPGGNRLLMAGYLAHEFLSRGTLFGRPYGCTAATAANEKQQYEEVARILWGGGACVPGVINPTQLRGWLQKQQEK